MLLLSPHCASRCLSLHLLLCLSHRVTLTVSLSLCLSHCASRCLSLLLSLCLSHCATLTVPLSLCLSLCSLAVSLTVLTLWSPCDSLQLSLIISTYGWDDECCSSTMLLYTLTLTHSLSLVLAVMMRSTEIKISRFLLMLVL